MTSTPGLECFDDPQTVSRCFRLQVLQLLRLLDLHVADLPVLEGHDDLPEEAGVGQLVDGPGDEIVPADLAVSSPEELREPAHARMITESASRAGELTRSQVDIAACERYQSCR